MVSVTGRIKEVKQPYGGYLPIKDMTIEQYEDDIVLHPYENSAPTLVGIAVDYLTRVELGDDPREAFAISLHGLRDAVVFEIQIGRVPDGIPTDLSDQSIIDAVILSSFDSVFRAGAHAYAVPEIPDAHTIENIRHMVKRNIDFFEKVGPITQSGFTFEGGYTDIIHAGDGDMLTRDGLWDLKVYRGKFTSQHTLQLLIYWRMGLHSIHSAFHDITHLGFYNPRKNESTVINVSDLSEEMMVLVDTEVIGY